MKSEVVAFHTGCGQASNKNTEPAYGYWLQLLSEIIQTASDKMAFDCC